MILIKIDALTTTELQYIAQQEGMEDWDTLSREDLIDALEDLYEDQETDDPAQRSGRVNRKRFCNSLTDFRGSEKEANLPGDLPGVMALPEAYHETSIHLLMRDPSWAYCFWSISPNVKARLEADNAIDSLFLRVTCTNLSDADVVETFDLAVSAEDDYRNINLSKPGYSYTVCLCCERSGMEAQQLCRSNQIETPKAFWNGHLDMLNKNPQLFRLYFSSLVTKEGAIVDNMSVREIADYLSTGKRS